MVKIDLLNLNFSSLHIKTVINHVLIQYYITLFMIIYSRRGVAYPHELLIALTRAKAVTAF